MRLYCAHQRGTSNPVSCDIAPLRRFLSPIKYAFKAHFIGDEIRLFCPSLSTPPGLRNFEGHNVDSRKTNSSVSAFLGPTRPRHLQSTRRAESGLPLRWHTCAQRKVRVRRLSCSLNDHPIHCLSVEEEEVIEKRSSQGGSAQ